MNSTLPTDDSDVVSVETDMDVSALFPGTPDPDEVNPTQGMDVAGGLHIPVGETCDQGWKRS